MDQIYKEAIKFHKKHHGKIEISSKVPIKNRRDLSLAYTPGVGAVSREIHQNNALVREYTLKRNAVAIISDGSAILGLGNLGAEAAIPVMEGKAVLFKKFADIDAFPICLKTQNAEEIIAVVKAVAPVFGGINLEDISAPRCFEIENRLQQELSLPVMHDDQHGTAVVVLAGLINALRVKGIKNKSGRIIINGAGAAGTAVSKLLIEYGFKNIVVCDSKGTIYSGRRDMNREKKELARLTNPGKLKGGLREAIQGADVFIGVSRAGLLTTAMVRGMKAQPIIFALANPVPEIMPDTAFKAGALIVATGRSDFPNQLNNVLAFPGIFRGALDHGVKKFTTEMFLNAAKSLAACVKNPQPDKILPNVFNKSVVKAVAKEIHE